MRTAKPAVDAIDLGMIGLRKEDAMASIGQSEPCIQVTLPFVVARHLEKMGGQAPNERDFVEDELFKTTPKAPVPHEYGLFGGLHFTEKPPRW